MSENYGEIGFLKKTILNIISRDVDTAQEVVGFEKTGFRGFPAITVICTGSENSFYSSAENERIFNFTLRVFVPIENKPKLESTTDAAKENAEKIMERTVDQLLAAFDTTTSFTLEGAADNGVEAVPSGWGYALIDAGWCRTAAIELKIRRTLNVSTGLTGG